ncbi:hypothetical protein ACLOJK_032058 [Asimina triloba]
MVEALPSCEKISCNFLTIRITAWPRGFAGERDEEEGIGSSTMDFPQIKLSRVLWRDVGIRFSAAAKSLCKVGKAVSSGRKQGRKVGKASVRDSY